MPIKIKYEIHANALMDPVLNTYLISSENDKKAIKKAKELIANNKRICYIYRVINDKNKVLIFKNKFYEPIK